MQRQQLRDLSWARLLLSVLQGAVLAGIVWQVYCIAALLYSHESLQPSFQTSFQELRQYCQLSAGLALLLLATLLPVLFPCATSADSVGNSAGSKGPSLAHWLALSSAESCRCLVLASTGLVSAVTSFPAVLAVPGAAFLLYTILGRLVELGCLLSLQLEASTTVAQHAGAHAQRLSVLPKSGGGGAQQCDEDAADERETAGIALAGPNPSVRSRGYVSTQRGATRMSDCVHPGPLFPGWVQLWMQQPGPSAPPPRRYFIPRQQDRDDQDEVKSEASAGSSSSAKEEGAREEEGLRSPLVSTHSLSLQMPSKKRFRAE